MFLSMASICLWMLLLFEQIIFNASRESSLLKSDQNNITIKTKSNFLLLSLEINSLKQI